MFDKTKLHIYVHNVYKKMHKHQIVIFTYLCRYEALPLCTKVIQACAQPSPQLLAAPRVGRLSLERGPMPPPVAQVAQVTHYAANLQENYNLV